MSLFVSSQDSKYNKRRCEQLRLIRKDLAEKLGIGYKIRSTPCEFKGKCKGTCPACEAEEKELLNALYKFNSNKGIKITNTANEVTRTNGFSHLPTATPGMPAPYEYLQDKYTQNDKENKESDKNKPDINNDNFFVMGEPLFGDIPDEYGIDESKICTSAKEFNTVKNPFVASKPRIPDPYERPITMGVPAPPQLNTPKKKGKRK